MAPEIYASDDPSVREYLQIAWRRRLTILLVLGLVCAVALGRAVSQDALYESSADVLLVQNDRAVSLTGGDPGVLREDPERFAVTQARLARVDEVLRGAVDRANLAVTLSELRHTSSVEPAADADFLRFTVTSLDTDNAIRLATEYAREFSRYRAQLDNAAIARALRGVTQQLQLLRADGRNGTDAYAQLVRTQQQLSTLQLLQNPRAIVAGTPSSATQVAPRPLRDVVIAAVLGLMLALAVAYFLEALDTRLRSADDVATRVGVPLLGSTLPAPRRAGVAGLLPTVYDPAGVHAEAYRMLRLNVEFANLQTNARLVMVTSAVSGEGKTVTAANLAVSFARAGRRVLLVDLDLRRPRQHELFNVPPAPGITDVTLGRASLEDTLLRHALSGHLETRSRRLSSDTNDTLDLLTAGGAVPDPGTFVENEELMRLLGQLNQRYELIVVDTPPLLSVGDGLALGGICDAAIVVSAVGRLRKSEARELRHALASLRALKLGVVVTGVEARAAYSSHSERDEPVVELPTASASGRWSQPAGRDA